MPAFVRSIRESQPGYGSPSNYGVVTGDALTATGTITIPATGATTPTGGTAFNTSGGPPPTRGRGRIRASSVNGATTLAFLVTVTDGTVVAEVFVLPTTAAGTIVDVTFEFNTDLQITSVSCVATLAGGTQAATIDFEIAMST